MTAAVDRHLLFGLLALQTGIINQGQLEAAFQAWTLAKSKSLADHLEDRGELDADDRAAIGALVARHLKRHAGDVRKSVAAVSAARSTKESLVRIGDPDIDATLAHVGLTHGPAEGGDDDLTTSYSVGMGTSEGQRFRILRPHARGGLGVVFVALDEELKREVALKQILEHHADDPTSRQRFLIEAEITGGLEHPGIVPVYGLGSYGDGRPYYAMRFIKGDSLKEAIEHFHGDGSRTVNQAGRPLALRKLLRRFTDVCNAIDYAHSRGVLHRDIKPGNIIVGKYGETLVVDWGLAKPLGRVEPGQESGERTLVPFSASGSAETLPGSALGTPAYMSPEQARGDLDRLGPRSDVYSLGATLHCLLTGKPPFKGDDIGAVLRKVQRGSFAPPRAIDPTIDAALEAICLKAMALEPEDRYGACRALADDVERWMADEPVSAWREPLSRRARRWARRNRTAVTSLAAAVLMALAGTGAVLAVQTRANADLMGANRELAVANKREKQRFDLAIEAIKLFHGQVGDDLVLKADQFKPLRDKLLLGALDFYGKLEGLLKGQPDRGSRGAMGNAYFEFGELTAKIGDKPAALAAHRKGLAVRRELAAEPVDDVKARVDVAQSLFATAYLVEETGNSVEALARLEEARDLLESLPNPAAGSQDHRGLLGSVFQRMGVALASTGKTDAAMTAFQRSLEVLTGVVDDNPADTVLRSRLADGHNSIGIQQSETGRPVEALVSYRRALAIVQKLADDHPAITEFRHKLAVNHSNIGALQSDIGKPVEALESFRRTVAIQQKLADDNPAVTKFRDGLAYGLGNAGWILMHDGKAAEAIAEFSREETIRTKLVAENPSVPVYRELLANCQTNKATALLLLGRPAEARELCGRAVRLRDSLVNEDPETVAYRAGLAESLVCSGLAHRNEDDAAGAAAQWRRADALLEGLGAVNLEFTFLHACCHASLSWSAGRPASGAPAGEADAEAVKALELLRSAAEMGYRNPATYRAETALDPLRDRDDFRLMMMDLGMPADPFAR